MAKVYVTQAGGSGGSVATGVLQLSGGAAMSSTLTAVTDQNNTASPLKLSTTAVQTLSTLKITTSDNPYIDAEDGAGNNRFQVGREPSSQVVNIDFASNPTGGTNMVGGIRTYTDGVNLAQVMSFRKDGNVGIGTTAPTYKFMVSDNSANDGAVFFEKDLLGGQSDCYVYNKNASTNLTTGQLIGTLTFGGYFNSTFSPGVQDVAAIFGLYTGTGTNRKGQLQFKTHDSSGMQTAMTINDSQLVGIGETSPTARLQIKGKGSTSATTSLLVQNSGGSTALQIRDDRSIDIVANELGNNAWGQSIKFFGSSGEVRTTLGGGAGFFGTWYNAGSEQMRLSASQNLLLGTATDIASSKFTIESTTQGFLPPRMTNAQRLAIATPAVGLMVYCTDAVEGLYIYKSTGWTFII